MTIATAIPAGASRNRMRFADRDAAKVSNSKTNKNAGERLVFDGILHLQTATLAGICCCLDART